MTTLYWLSADEQGSIAMGEFATEAAAREAVEAAEAELLGQCSSEEERAQIRAGSWIWAGRTL